MDNDFRQKFAMMIDLADLSRSRIAREIGVDKSVVSRWVSGATRPSPASLDNLTDNLAGRVSGLLRADWDLSLANFSAKFARSPLQRGDREQIEQGGESAPRQEISFCRSFDGVPLAVAAMGDGPVLVKAPNWLTHIDYDMASPIWGPTLRRLAHRFRLVRYDARGNGLSDWSKGAADFPTAVRDFETVVDRIGAERVSILGISQGAATALAYAAAHPERVERLFLHGGYVRGRHKRDDEMELVRSRLVESLIQTSWVVDKPVYANALASLFIPSASPDQIRSFGQLQRVSASIDTVLEMKRALDDIDLSPILAEVRAPVLVTHARGDQIVPFAEGRVIAAGVPGATFVTLESDNHVAMPAEPAWEKWMTLIEAFG